jgi:glycosyltransferase involved in cell wall biosynthesis
MSLKKKYKYEFTVFTATYNRDRTLNRVYESLKTQTYRNFEWLIVDDGSTDNTKQLVEEWQQKAEFPIRYIYQENGGLHIALNRGTREAWGKLFLQLDSDDSCIPQALERFKYHWDTIPIEQRKLFSGVTCLCNDQQGQVVGNLFPFNPTDSDALEIYYRYKVVGEKWGFHRTEVLLKFPYSEEHQRTYLPQSLIWNQIARKYKTRFVNEALRIYWMDVPSITRGNQAVKGAFGNRLNHLTSLNNDLDWFTTAPLLFLRTAVHYSRFSFHVKVSIFEQFKSLRLALGKLLWLTALPVGYTVYLKDTIRSQA